MSSGDARRPDKLPLIDGVRMVCPRCKKYRNVLDFDRLEQNVEYEKDTNAIYKCPKARGGCSFIFSPADHTIMENLFT